MTVAAYVQPSNYTNIQAAIYDIALNQAGLTFNGHKLGELPTADELQAQGTPFLAVRPGLLVDWLDRNERGIGTTMPVWHFDVYAIAAPFTPESDPAKTTNYADQLKMTLHTTYMAQYDLEATCLEGSPHQMETVYLTVSGIEYVCAKITVRAVEILDMRYS